MATVRSLDVAVRANTQNFEGGMRRVSVALRGAVQGLNAITAASAAQEKNFLQIANSLAIGFAAGGPLGLALAGAGVGLGLLIGKYKELKAETDKAAESQRKFAAELSKIEQRSFAVANEIRFINLYGREGSPEEVRAQQLRDLIEKGTAQQRKLEIDSRTEGMDTLRAASEVGEAVKRYKQELFELDRLIGRQTDKSTMIADIDAQAKAAADAAAKVRKELEQVPLSTQVAADAVFALLDGIIVRGAKASDVLRGVLQNIASIGLRIGINNAFGLQQPS